MFDFADLEARWVAFDAAPDVYDVEPPVDQWAAAMTITDRTRDLSRSIGSLASAIRAAAPAASDGDLVGWLTWLSEADNRLPTADHAVVAELDSRNTAEAYLYRRPPGC